MTDHDSSSATVTDSRALPKSTQHGSTYLRADDQKSIVCIALCLLAWLAGSTTLYAINMGGLVHIDALPKREAVFQVDMNEADWTEISALPTIGETMARRIVAHREANGPFSSLQSLSLVDGVGVHTINSIQPHVANLPVSDKMVVDTR